MKGTRPVRGRVPPLDLSGNGTLLTDGTPGSGNEKKPPVLPFGAIASPFLAVFVNDMLSTILITHSGRKISPPL